MFSEKNEMNFESFNIFQEEKKKKVPLVKTDIELVYWQFHPLLNWLQCILVLYIELVIIFSLNVFFIFMSFICSSIQLMLFILSLDSIKSEPLTLPAIQFQQLNPDPSIIPSIFLITIQQIYIWLFWQLFFSCFFYGYSLSNSLFFLVLSFFYHYYCTQISYGTLFLVVSLMQS